MGIQEPDSLRAIGLTIAGESFDTGKSDALVGVFFVPSIDSLGQLIPIENRKPELLVRESDIAAHSLVKNSPIRRRADGKTYTVRKFDHDGTGMTTILLGA